MYMNITIKIAQITSSNADMLNIKISFCLLHVPIGLIFAFYKKKNEKKKMVQDNILI